MVQACRRNKTALLPVSKIARRKVVVNMKAAHVLRYLFQSMVFLFMLSIIGSLGAWETGEISFVQMLLQIAVFSLLAVLCARLGRWCRRLRRRRRPVRRLVYAARQPAAIQEHVHVA